MKSIWKILLVCSCVSCHSNSERKNRPIVSKTVEKSVPSTKINKVEPVSNGTMEFVSYNDDGDYFLLNAKQKEQTFSFINDSNDDRSLLRGDIIDIAWKKDSIYIAGDGETRVEAERIISVKKIKDGNVSRFRKDYPQPLKYTWPQEEHYTKSYLDKLYILTEYYIANSSNALLKQQIKKKGEISYSIEMQTREGKEYILLSIAAVTAEHAEAIQWLYIDNDTDLIYEYDLPQDRLVKFK
ncbi:hypothetical protein [Pedobacter psychrodurus]|uniref:hypothetical protein n=1 Tax=Pedobacter psychrodurus TaxID=2530456 RepID=UPI00292F9CD6|nr:hypothetical protein [Pedobacter psychrodurus]